MNQYTPATYTLQFAGDFLKILEFKECINGIVLQNAVTQHKCSSWSYSHLYEPGISWLNSTLTALKMCCMKDHYKVKRGNPLGIFSYFLFVGYIKEETSNMQEPNINYRYFDDIIKTDNKYGTEWIIPHPQETKLLKKNQWNYALSCQCSS